MVDSVEHHVAASGGYLEAAREELTKAQEYQSKARKVLCMANTLIHKMKEKKKKTLKNEMKMAKPNM